jgi:hypothetical protein
MFIISAEKHLFFLLFWFWMTFMEMYNFWIQHIFQHSFFLFLDYLYVKFNFSSPSCLCSYPQYLFVATLDMEWRFGTWTPQWNLSNLHCWWYISSLVLTLACSSRQHGCVCAITFICSLEFHSDFQDARCFIGRERWLSSGDYSSPR